MISDNRFLPFLYHPPIGIQDCKSVYKIDMFALTAAKAVNDSEDVIGIPELYGAYDLKDINKGLAAIGLSVDLSEQLFFQDGTDFPFTVNGKIQAQGAQCTIFQAITDNFVAGLGWYFLRVDSRQIFSCPGRVFTDSEKQQLEVGRLAMNNALGLSGPYAHQASVGDLEAFIALNNRWQYSLKFRSIYADCRLGMFAPLAQSQQPNVPASIPLGGNGHWGLYAQGDVEFELKEDLSAGFMLRLSKRLQRINIMRMPVGNEPAIFGPVVGPVLINPGFTGVFTPYVYLENLREGLGVLLQLTVIEHGCDSWRDVRLDQSVPVKLSGPSSRSAWGADFGTFQVFYDFGKIMGRPDFEPIATFTWDFPVGYFNAHNVCNTNKLALGLEMNF